jgi:hypothetical protein
MCTLEEIGQMRLICRFKPLLFLLLTFQGQYCQSANTCENPETCQFQEEFECSLWLGESLNESGGLGGYFGLFVGFSVEKNSSLIENGGEPHIPVSDFNDYELSHLSEALFEVNDISADMQLQTDFQTYSFLPGIGITAACNDRHANAFLRKEDDEIDSLGVHRSAHAHAGSFTYRYHSDFIASRNLVAGQEILVPCGRPAHSGVSSDQEEVKSIEDLRQNAVCVDSLQVKKSTIPNAGRGAFAKRPIKKGEVITYSPAIVYDFSKLYITEQSFDEEDRELVFGEMIESYQLLENYSFGHKDSNIMLLPTGPGVHSINHNSAEANTKLQWSSHDLNEELEFLDLSDVELYVEDRLTMLVEYVALQDIEAGDEIFLDYSNEWEQHFARHRDNWQIPPFASSYQSAADYVRENQNEPIKTMSEQKDSKYPRNLQTTCLFQETYRNDDHDWQFISESESTKTNSSTSITWNASHHNGCLRPCRILDRTSVDNSWEYVVEVRGIESELSFKNKECWLNGNKKIVTKIPHSAVKLTDRKYTSDEHLEDTFRHYIHVPDDFYPDEWLEDDDDDDMGDFELSKLDEGQIDPVHWTKDKNNGEIVAPHTYRMGLPKSLRRTIFEYVVKIGMFEYFKHITYRGNSLGADEDYSAEFAGLAWHVQRPPEHRNSDMHWISPIDKYTHEDYLEVLSQAGFDSVLQSIGETLGLEGLTAYHLSFIGVSHCSEGSLHQDVAESGGKVFNMIIPLISVDNSGPELNLSDVNTLGDDVIVGRLRYEEDVAIMLGNSAYHATSAVDYRTQRQFQLAATIYIADISSENIDAIMKHYTQEYPPYDDSKALLELSASHWSSSDPTVRLPRYIPPEGEGFFDDYEGQDAYGDDDYELEDYEFVRDEDDFEDEYDSDDFKDSNSNDDDDFTEYDEAEDSSDED